MATTEQEVPVQAGATSTQEPAAKIKSRKQENILDKLLRLLSSVRFGIVMLSLLLICCMIGMIIMQKDVDGFLKYYRELTPSQRKIWGYLGFFDIYHVWYFNLLLAITGLNIILASIDRFPAAWAYISKPKLSASPNFIHAQNLTTDAHLNEKSSVVVENIKAAWRKHGFKARVTEENNRITVFAQRNVWNRLGAYVVHVALLTIFLGGFLTSRYGLGGMMQIIPGETSNTFVTSDMTLEGPRMGNAAVPFDIECTDLQQKLIRPEGGLDAQNTIDWLSFVKVHDSGQQTDAVVHMNNPFDIKGSTPPRLRRAGQGGETQPTGLELAIHKVFGGYRLFQSQFTPIGNARSIDIWFEPVGGGETQKVSIPRNGSANVPGIGNVEYVDFFPDFQISQQGPGTISPDYNNPVAQLRITKADGMRQNIFAVNGRFAEEFYASRPEAIDKDSGQNLLLINNHKAILKDFEKVALGHTLAVQYDPGRTPVYFGFGLLSLALCMVFFFSHQRVWAVIEPDGNKSKVYFGGNTNRNRASFEPRFNTLVESVTGERSR